MMLHFDTWDGPTTEVFHRRSPLRPPRRVLRRDGKQGRQMIMGLALGLHVMERHLWNFYFTVKTRYEAQILFVLVTPFLVIPLAVLAIPMVFLVVSAMMAAGITSNLDNFASFQTVMDRQMYYFAKKKRNNSKKKRKKKKKKQRKGGDDDDDDDDDEYDEEEEEYVYDNEESVERRGRFGLRQQQQQQALLAQQQSMMLPRAMTTSVLYGHKAALLAPREMSTRRGQVLRSQSHYYVQYPNRRRT